MIFYETILDSLIWGAKNMVLKPLARWQLWRTYIHTHTHTCSVRGGWAGPGQHLCPVVGRGEAGGWALLSTGPWRHGSLNQDGWEMARHGACDLQRTQSWWAWRWPLNQPTSHGAQNVLAERDAEREREGIFGECRWLEPVFWLVSMWHRCNLLFMGPVRLVFSIVWSLSYKITKKSRPISTV